MSIEIAVGPVKISLENLKETVTNLLEKYDTFDDYKNYTIARSCDEVVNYFFGKNEAYRHAGNSIMLMHRTLELRYQLEAVTKSGGNLIENCVNARPICVRLIQHKQTWEKSVYRTLMRTVSPLVAKAIVRTELVLDKTGDLLADSFGVVFKTLRVGVTSLRCLGAVSNPTPITALCRTIALFRKNPDLFQKDLKALCIAIDELFTLISVPLSTCDLMAKVTWQKNPQEEVQEKAQDMVPKEIVTQEIVHEEKRSQAVERAKDAALRGCSTLINMTTDLRINVAVRLGIKEPCHLHPHSTYRSTHDNSDPPPAPHTYKDDWRRDPGRFF